MYEMILIINMQQSYTDDLEYQNERLRQQLESLGIDPYGGARTSIARPSDAYYSKPLREWSPLPDPYQRDDIARGQSPWPNTHQQNN